MKRLILLLLTLDTVSAHAEKPNILFLLSDDHSYPFLGTFGDGNVQTPVLDRMAAEGMKFHRFYTTAPQCVPSRASLMTGRSPVAARITRFSSPLMREEIIFPELLRSEAGYYTGICGRSYHLDGSGKKGGGAGASADILEKHKLRTFQDRVDVLESGSDAKVPERIEAFLKSKPADKPFFLWANFSDPHHPWEKGAELRPDPAKLKLRPAWPDQPGLREQLADYCAEVNHLDATLGKIVEMLIKLGVYDNTLIVFTGDNGMAMPRGKGSLQEDGCHVPMLVRWPGKVKAGSESRSLLSGEDLAPTLLEAAGVKIPTKITGQSFLPLLEGREYKPRSYVFTERGPHGSAPVGEKITSNAYDLSRAVCNDRYRLIYNCTPWIPYSPVDSASGAGWKGMAEAHLQGKLPAPLVAAYFTAPRPVYELYDLQADPAELSNIFDHPQHATVQRELLLAMTEKMITDFDFLPLPNLPAPTEEPSAENPRAKQFLLQDKDHDGQLSKEEFLGKKQDPEAAHRFLLRDRDKSNSLSKEEFLPGKLPEKLP